MANIARTVEIIFLGESSGLAGTITGINQGFELLSKIVNSIVDPLANLSEGLRNVGKAIASISVDVLKQALEVSREYERATVELTRATSDQVYSLDTVKKAVMDMAYAYGDTETNIMASAAAFAHAGFTMEESLTGAQAALQLTVLGSDSLFDATERLIAVMIGLRTPFDETQRIVDMLSKVATVTGTDIDRLSDSFAQSAQVGSNAGLEWEEMAAMLATVGEVFRGGEEAASAFKITLARLADATGSTKRALEELGIEQKDQNGQLKTAGALLKEVMEHMHGLSEAEQQRIANMVAGNRQGQRMILVLEDTSRWTDTYKKATESAGYAQEQMTKILETAEKAADRYGAMLENLSRVVGDKLQAEFAGLTDAVTELGRAFAESIEAGAFDPILDEFKGTMDELKEYIKDIAKILPEALAAVDFGPLLAAWEEFVDTISSYLDGIDLRKPEDLTKVLQTMSDTLATLIQVLEGMAKELKPVWDQIQAGIDIINNLDPATKESFGGLLLNSELVKKFGLIFTGIFDEIMDSVIQSTKGINVFATDMEISMNTLDLWSLKISKAFLEAQHAVLTFLDTLPFTEFSDSLAAIEVSIEETGLAIEGATKRGIELDEQRVEGFKQLKMSSEELVDYLLKQKEVEESATETSKEHTKALEEFGTVLDGLPDIKKITIEPGESIENFLSRIKELDEGIVALPDGKIIPITPSFKEEALEQIRKELTDLENTETIVEIKTEVDTAAFDEVLQDLEKIPDEKLIEVAIANLEGLFESVEDAEREVKRVFDEQYLLDLGIDVNTIETIKAELAELMVNIMQIQEPADVKILIPDIEEITAKIVDITKKINDIPEEKKSQVNIQATGAKPEEIKKDLEKIPTRIDIEIRLREVAIKEFEAQTDRIVKVGEVANERLKTSVDLAKTQIEADANIMIAALQGLADSIGSVADAAASMYESYANAVKQSVTSTQELQRVFDVIDNKASDFANSVGRVSNTLEGYNDELQESVRRTMDLIKTTNDLQQEIVNLNKSLDDTKKDIKEYSKMLKELDAGTLSDAGLTKKLAQIDALYDKLAKGIKMGMSAEQLRAISDEIDRLTESAELYEKALEDPTGTRKDLYEKIITAKEREQELNLEIKETENEIKLTEAEIVAEREKQAALLAQIKETLIAMGYTEREVATIIDGIKNTLDDIYKDAMETDDYFRSWTTNLSEASKKIKEFSEKLATMFEDSLKPFLDDFAAKQMEMFNEWVKDTIVPSFEKLGVDIATMVGAEVAKNMLSPSDKEYLRNILSKQIAMERDLVDAQVAYMEAVTKVADAKADAYRKGMPEIKVTAEGLEPELEAFMWKILDRIQTRVSEQYGEFLLGLYGMNTSTEEII
jgi:TP901 family phage tail tape measure protein